MKQRSNRGSGELRIYLHKANPQAARRYQNEAEREGQRRIAEKWGRIADDRSAVYLATSTHRRSAYVWMSVVHDEGLFVVRVHAPVQDDLHDIKIEKLIKRLAGRLLTRTFPHVFKHWPRSNDPCGSVTREQITPKSFIHPSEAELVFQSPRLPRRVVAKLKNQFRKEVRFFADRWIKTLFKYLRTRVRTPPKWEPRVRIGRLTGPWNVSN